MSSNIDKEIFKEMDLSEIQYPYNKIIETIGIDNFISLCEIYGAGSIYFPTLKSLTMGRKIKKIKEEYNGYNDKELAWKYKVSHSTVYRACKKNKNRKKRVNEKTN